MIPDFAKFLPDAAQRNGVDRAEADHEVNLLVASQHVGVIQQAAATTAHITSAEGRKNYAELVDQKVRAFRIVADALEAYNQDVRAALGLSDSRPKPE